MIKKGLFILIPALMFLGSCNNQNNTSTDDSFKFQVLANIDYYNGNPNYVMYDEDNGYYANVRLGTSFYIPFRYRPLNYPERDIAFYIEDESICKMDSEYNGRINTIAKGSTTVSIEPIYYPEFRVDITVRVL